MDKIQAMEFKDEICIWPNNEMDTPRMNNNQYYVSLINK